MLALKLKPCGQVATYKDIAKYLGRPKAARAVGNVCGRNQQAPKISCHRAIKSDGSLGGYSRGARKKIYLLKKAGIKVVNDKIENFIDKKI